MNLTPFNTAYVAFISFSIVPYNPSKQIVEDPYKKTSYLI